MNILFFGHSSFAAKSLQISLKNRKRVIFYSRKKNKKNSFFDLKISNNKILNKKKFNDPQIILFFSSYVPFKENIPNWRFISKINIDGINNFLKNLKFKPRKIILISSCAVYGNEKKYVSEKDFLKPISPYAITKLAQENVFQTYCKINKIKLFTLRLGYVYGDKMMNIRLLKKFKNLINNNKKINIYNKNYNLNLVHTEDIKNIILKSLYKNQGLLNLVHEKRISIENFVNVLNKMREPNLKKLKKNEFFSKNFKTYFPKFKFYKLSDAIKGL